jgi:hypothetical protein
MTSNQVNVNELIQWYCNLYPQYKIPLIDLKNSFETFDGIDLDMLETGCQRICNPSDYTIEENDPIDWSQFI